MFKIIRSLGEADPEQLFNVYEHSLIEELSDQYGASQPYNAMLQKQQDFYTFLMQFFSEKGSLYAVWFSNNRYCSALRLEPYRDGFILTGLETAADQRKKGYASKLIQAVMQYCEENALLPIYSHIANTNIASIKAHVNNGFYVVSDSAVFLDGSVDQRSKTYCYSSQKKTKS